MSDYAELAARLEDDGYSAEVQAFKTMKEAADAIKALVQERDELKRRMEMGWSFKECPGCGQAFLSEVNWERELAAANAQIEKLEKDTAHLQECLNRA